MRSVRCDVCGTKALMAASKCPKCSHPFAVRDGFGELLPLGHCPTCDSDYPLSAGVCKWCGTPPEKTPIGPYVWKGVGVAAFLSLAVGAFLIRDDSPATEPALLVPTADSGTVAAATDSSNNGQTILQASPTDTGVVINEVVSTGVVGGDSSRALALSDSARATTEAGDDTTLLADGSATVADDPIADSIDAALVRVDSARVREPWLPAPSVIRRAPPPEPTPSDPARDAAASSASAGNPSTATTSNASPPETPPVTARTPRPVSAAPRSVATRSSTPPPRATSRPAPSATKPKPPSKAVARTTPKRAPSTSAPARNARSKVATPATRTPTKVAKAPAARPRTSARWVTSVARQWAVVRADADSRGRIIGSVGPDTRVQLGESRNGFRRIKAKGLAGWVHGRAVFVTAPPRRSGRLATQ
jgi:hypothetical protein